MSDETMAKVFMMLSRAYPDWASKYLQGEEGAQTMRLYARLLGDIPDDVLEAATLDHIANSPWWPKMDELRKRCVALMANITDLPSPYEAWALVCRYIRHPSVPRYHNGAIRDDQEPLPPLIRRAMEGIGGEEALRMSENPAADRARFIEAYEALLEREHRRLAELPAVAEVRKRLRKFEELEDGNG